MTSSKLKNSIQDSSQAESRLISAVRNKYPERLSDYVRLLLQEGRYSPQAARQYTLSAEELKTPEGYAVDACNEGLYRRGKAIIHKYENRAAFVLTNICFVYCRFCFRKAVVGQPGHSIRSSDLTEGLTYIQDSPEVIDVLLTGGDPMSVSNAKLKKVIEGLSAIKHVKVIRIDSRALNTAPSRFDPELMAIFKNSGKVRYHAHLNHPDDLQQPEVLDALGQLHAAGVPVLNQFVLLHGVNDDITTIKSLLLTCYANKIIPYNMYLPDRTTGTAHFHVPKEVIKEIFEAISRLPGPAQPALVAVDSKNLKQRALYNCYVDMDGFLKEYYNGGPVVSLPEVVAEGQQ